MNNNKKKFNFKYITLMLGLVSINAFAADPVNPPNIPLETGGAIGTKPNIMFVLDDSGSMGFDFMGDEVGNSSTGARNCKSASASTGAVTQFSRVCASRDNATNVRTGTNGVAGLNSLQSVFAGDTPFFAYQFNKIYYNPSAKYVPGVDYLGNDLATQTIGAAQRSVYNNPALTINLLTDLRETYFCTKSNPTSAELTNKTICRVNGIDTPNPFIYHSQALPNATYRFAVRGPTTPHYYNIIPTDFCDVTGVNCSSNPATGNPFPVRWCRRSNEAISATVPSGKFVGGSNNGQNQCQAKYVAGTYIFPRYGQFERVAVQPSEYENFANWYAYYRDRMTAMKTSVGIAFKNIDNTRRVGFKTINFATSKFLPIRDFNIIQKQAFYDTLYAQSPNGGTPLREALSRAGRYYAGKSDGINNGMINTTTRPDPVQFSCQQNFTILSTDGYWNSNNGDNLTGGDILNEDNVNSGFSTRASGAFDGALNGASSTLSDVAMYYYKTDLRPTGTLGAGGVDVSENNVPISALNQNQAQHMVTYAIALGLDGFLNYTKDYDKGTNQDFENIKKGISGACSWTTGVCNWPVPQADTLSAIDDLWHATVNGRGKYFSAQNTNDIVAGLTEALSNLIVQTGASAAAATSSPNITSGDNFLYYTTYRTSKWDGEIAARVIDPSSGVISNTDLWSARTLLNGRVGQSTDTRNMYYLRNTTGTTELRNFNFASMNATERGYFSNKCATGSLSQCGDLGLLERVAVDTGVSLIDYLRGQRANEINGSGADFYREREFILGDIVNTSPVFVGESRNQWTDVGYAAFAATTASRTKALYVGANDGQIHAFNATTGQELWSIVPSQVMSKMWKLADLTYPTSHDFFVDGPISVSDAQIGGNWRTVLISGMGAGSKGYVAIDVTNPNSPVPLWEFCTTAGACSRTDNELGLTFGNPIITKRSFDGQWVAYLSAGYDNATGRGVVYEVSLATGATLRKLVTGTGTPASPAGVAKINTFYDNFSQNNTATILYAGDLDGNVWKWDLTNSAATTAQKLGEVRDASGNVQPITVKPEIGKINGFPVLFFGTGRYLNFADYSTSSIQTVYAVKDNNMNNGNFRLNAGMVGQTITSTGIVSQSTTNGVNWDSNLGWYFDLVSQVGERVNIDASLALGTLNVISNVPGNTTCTAGGNAWYYQVNFLNGGAVPGGDGFVAKKLTGGLVVGQVIARLDGSGGLKNFITDAGGTVTPVGVQVNTGALTNQKNSWREFYRKQ